MAEGGRAAEEGSLRALGGDGDFRAERGEQRGSPGAGNKAYRVGLVEAVGGIHHANRAGSVGAYMMPTLCSTRQIRLDVIFDLSNYFKGLNGAPCGIRTHGPRLGILVIA